MAEAGGVINDATAVKAEATKVRRKSRELESELGDMAEASDAWKSLGGGRRARRGSRDLAIYNDEALQEAFNTVDKSGDGQIDYDELSAAIKAMDPKASDQVGRALPARARAPHAARPPRTAAERARAAVSGHRGHDEVRRQRRRRQVQLRGVQEDHVVQTGARGRHARRRVPVDRLGGAAPRARAGGRSLRRGGRAPLQSATWRMLLPSLT